MTGIASFLTVILNRERYIYSNMLRLSLEERNRLLGHLQAGGTPTELAKLFGISRRAVYKIKSKYENHGTLKDRPKSGRPRLTDHQTYEHIVETYTATPMKQVLPFSSEVGVSARTVVRRLNFVGLYAHRPICLFNESSSSIVRVVHRQ